MFDVIGLRPEDAARLTALVEQCRPVLESDGMESVQAFLAERGISVIQAIAITRELLGNATTPLRVAIDIVTTSTARNQVGPDKQQLGPGPAGAGNRNGSSDPAGAGGAGLG